MSKLDLKMALEKNGAVLDEKQIRFVEGLQNALTDAFKNNKEDVSKVIEDKLKTIDFKMPEETLEDIRMLGERFKKIEENSPNTKLNEFQKISLRHKVRENHTAIVDAIKNKKEHVLGNIVLDTLRMAAAPHQNANGTVTLGSGVSYPLVENFGESDIIATIRQPENFIFDVIRNTQLSKVENTLIKVEQVGVEEKPDVVAEGGEKPLVQYKWVKNAISRKKIAGRIEWSEEFEIDNEKLFAAIVAMIERDVLKEWNDVTLAAIIANATAYTSSPWSGTIPSPNLDDLSVVLMTLINNANYNANTIVLNPVDLATLLLTKDNIGRRIESMILNTNQFGVKIVASTKVTAGKILVFDSSTYREFHTALDVRVGQYSDQFIKNMWTLIAEMYTLLDTAALDKVATYYGDIATILADLEAPVPTP